MSGAVERVRRILAAIPEGLGEQGASLPAVAERLGVSVECLTTDLQAAMMAGRFPFAPDDLIEIEFEGDRFRVHLAQRLRRPPRLTPEEAWALGAAARLFAGEAEMLDRAMLRVSAALDAAGRERVAGLERRLDLEARGEQADAAYHVLRQGARERRRVWLEYRAGGTGETTRRSFAPYTLIGVRGAWYAVGHCALREAVRILRVDRVLDARLSGERFEEPDDFDPDFHRATLLAGEWRGTEARLSLRGRAAQRARERLGEDGFVEGPDGSLEVSLQWGGLDGLAAWTLGQGLEAEVLDPPLLRRKIVADLQAALARYR